MGVVVVVLRTPVGTSTHERQTAIGMPCACMIRYIPSPVGGANHWPWQHIGYGVVILIIWVSKRLGAVRLSIAVGILMAPMAPAAPSGSG